MKNRIDSGMILNHVATGAITSGDIVVLGTDTLGVAHDTVATGETVAVSIAGQFTLAKLTGATWTQGENLHFNAGTFNSAAVGVPAGRAGADAASAATAGQVVLNV